MWKKILLSLFAAILLFGGIQSGWVYAAGCGSISLQPNGGGFSVDASGCTPNTTYLVHVVGSDGLIKASFSVTSDAQGSVSYVLASTLLTNGATYTVELFDPTSDPLLLKPVSSSSVEAGSNASDVTCLNGNGIDTAIGCIPFGDQNALIGFILRWAIGIGGGIAFLLILLAGFQIMTSRGDPKRLQAGQELMTSAIAGLLLLIFSIVILRIIGFDILQIKIFQ